MWKVRYMTFRKNIREYLHDLKIGHDFSNRTQKALIIKKKY